MLIATFQRTECADLLHCSVTAQGDHMQPQDDAVSDVGVSKEVSKRDDFQSSLTQDLLGQDDDLPDIGLTEKGLQRADLLHSSDTARRLTEKVLKGTVPLKTTTVVRREHLPTKDRTTEIRHTETRWSKKNYSIVRESKEDSNCEMTSVREGFETFPFQPVCTQWKSDMCHDFNIAYIHDSSTSPDHGSTIVNYSVKQGPLYVVPIRGDGNCYFRAISYVISGTEDNHRLMRALVVDSMRHNAQHLEMFCKHRRRDISMSEYLQMSRMMDDGVWATEVEIFGTASMLKLPVLTFGPYNRNHHWLQYLPQVPVTDNVHNKLKEAIYLRNVYNHFEPVVGM